MAILDQIELPDGQVYDIIDTTYESKTAASGGTDVSLCTTGEKYTWNNKSDKFVILSYGSSTWQNFIDAYSNNKVVYCRASSSADPATGSQTRLAFMAYVNNADSPTQVEFQYYRSVSSHTDSQQGDQVFVYLLKNTGAWSVTTRNAFTKIIAGDNITPTYTTGTSASLKLDATDTTYTFASGTNGFTVTPSSGTAQTITSYESKAATNGGTDVSLCTTGEKYTWNNNVAKSGDTMSGNLVIRKEKPQLIQRMMDYDFVSDNDVIGGLWMQGRYNVVGGTEYWNTVADVYHSSDSGNNNLTLSVFSYAIVDGTWTNTGTNYLKLGIGKTSDTPTVSVSAPATWRAALSAQEEEAGGALASGTNLNNLTTTKNYWVPNSGITNVPVANRYGYLEVIRTGQGSYLQRFTLYGNDTTADRGTTWIRFYINSQWYNWIKVAVPIS